MAFNRRDFLKGAMAAFAGALSPFSSPAKVIATVEPLGLEWNHFHSNRDVLLGIRGLPLRLIGQGAHIRWPQDGNLREHPTEISFERVVGPVPDMRVFRSLGDIGNRAEMLFGVSSWEGMPNFGYAFLRPVLLSYGRAFSASTRICDADGANAGEPIAVAPTDVIVITENVKLMCRRLPRAIADFNTTICECHGTFAAAKPRVVHGQKERGLSDAEYDRRLFAANAQNQDLNAWAEARDQLKDFDPRAFKTRRTV